MAGFPTEAEIEAQWQAAVQVLERTRSSADTLLAASAGGSYVALEAALEGQYTGPGLADALEGHRALYSQLLSPVIAQTFLTPILFEYRRILSLSATLGSGGGVGNRDELAQALFEWYHANSQTVETRAITYDTSVTAAGGNVGNGALSRLTVDRYGYDIEACHVERKVLRCRADSASGTQTQQEVFEMIGESQSRDNLLITAFGSGEFSRTQISNSNAGVGRGGSLLANSSFATFSSTGTPKFVGWTEASGSANIDQDTSNFYLPLPGQTTGHALEFSGNAKLTQSIATGSRVRRLDVNRPYFLRLMYNRQVGSGDGTLTLRLGSQSVSVVLAAQTGWNELTFPLDENLWFTSFNETDLDVEIELSGHSTGTVLVDDVILTDFTQFDGTWWVLRQNAATPVNWRVDDDLRVTDTGGLAGTGTIQYHFWRAFNRYLPSSGTPTLADPSV